ncbi:MAG: 50S ribosomal protein L17 [Chloroflexi bacterium]|nr:50S ribosomal protein L17 [Chloroflexota bacterium]
MTRKIPIRKGGKTEGYLKALRRNLVTDLLGYEKIVTTEAKAKQIRPIAEKMITLGKDGTLHSRRRALSYIFDKGVADKVFGELAERYTSRAGGYTRIVKLEPRQGDGAPMVLLELVK